MSRAAVRLPEPGLSRGHSSLEEARLGIPTVGVLPSPPNIVSPEQTPACLFLATGKARETTLNHSAKGKDEVLHEGGGRRKECGLSQSGPARETGVGA